jgi:hypothetical protein
MFDSIQQLSRRTELHGNVCSDDARTDDAGSEHGMVARHRCDCIETPSYGTDMMISCRRGRCRKDGFAHQLKQRADCWTS